MALSMVNISNYSHIDVFGHLGSEKAENSCLPAVVLAAKRVNQHSYIAGLAVKQKKLNHANMPFMETAEVIDNYLWVHRY